MTHQLIAQRGTSTNKAHTRTPLAQLIRMSGFWRHKSSLCLQRGGSLGGELGNDPVSAGDNRNFGHLGLLTITSQLAAVELRLVERVHSK